MRRRLVLLPAMLLLAACSAGIAGSGTRQAWSVTGALGTIQAGLSDSTYTMYLAADLDAATASAGSRRPAFGADDDEVRDWLSTITGANDSPVAAPLPLMESMANGNATEFAGELGWSIADVHTFVELSAPPARMTVLGGVFDASSLTAAMGDPQDGVWRVGPDRDGAVDLSQATAARPLGEALRTGLSGERLAVSTSTATVQAWLGGRDRLDVDATLAPLAAALDARGVYAAYLVPDASSFTSRGGDAEALPEPFDALALGLTVDGDRPVAVFAYEFADAETADRNVARIKTLATDGSSVATGDAWADQVEVTEAVAEGAVVVLTLRLLDGTSTTLGYRALVAQDSLVQHR